MSAYLARSVLFNRMAAGMALVILAIRVYQLLTFADGSFSASCGDLSASYFVITNIALAVFVLIPLFVLYLLPTLRLVKNTSYVIRNDGREGCVYSFMVLALAKAGLFAFMVSASSVPVLLARASVNAGGGDIMIMVVESMILEGCLFSVCAAMLFVVFVLTGSISGAMIALFFYVIWDYLADHVPNYAGTLPVAGWHLTEVSYPGGPFGFLEGFLPLSALFAFFVCVGLLVMHRRDIGGKSEVQGDV